MTRVNFGITDAGPGARYRARIMTLRGFLVSAALACGGSASEDAGPPITEPEPDPDMGSKLTLGFAPLESCGLVMPEPSFLSYPCKACVLAPVPHCVTQPVPDRPGREPAACANPDCEVPGLQMIVGSVDGGPVLHGACSDGKTFIASFGVTNGAVAYYRDGNAVGVARYSPSIGKCECGGESWSGDILCAEPTFEAPSESVALPFQDGKRASACLCAD
jgi:hypothetical protein